jgi:membrane protease YdiL (CAAX protease family)
LRGLCPSVFEGTWGGVGGAAIAALFFGAGHLPQGVAAAAVITVVGFGLGVIMVVHRSMWPAAIAHGAFDAASFAAIPWMMQHLDQFHHMGTV